MINYKSQEEFIAAYNSQYRPKFNEELFIRKDSDIINAIKAIIYSCERDSTFKIKVLDFDIIEDYEEILYILWEYEDNIINKKKKQEEDEAKKKTSSTKKKVNIYDFINIDRTDIILLKVTYYTEITETKNGLVNETFTVYIAVPRLVNDFYFRINGNLYSAVYQIVDASTYNNSASKNSRKQSITFKTVFTPIRVYRYTVNMVDIDCHAISCNYFVINVFKKSVLLMKYMLAKMGFYDTMKFLYIDGVNIVKSIHNISKEDFYIFPIRDMYIIASKILYNSIQIVQSFVYTIWNIINYMRDCEYNDFLNRETYIKALGADFTLKDIDTIYDKGISLLDSLEFNYDRLTMEDLKLPEEDKNSIYAVLRWMIYEFNALRQKENLDIRTKKVRYAEYIACLYATKLAGGIYRISDKGNKADLKTIKKALNIAPMFLINAITKCQLVNYKNCVNDMDSIVALKYTYKGNTGIGEKSNAISNAYRSVHPSHLGRVDIDSSSNSDPGVSGTICPYAELHDGHFDEYEEPNEWRVNISKILDIYRGIESKIEMCSIVSDHKIKQNGKGTVEVHEDCKAIAYNLASMARWEINNEEYINGFDLWGDGLMYILNE